MALKQAPRMLGLESPLGENVLVLTALAGHEALSGLFKFSLRMLSDNPAIKATDIVGKNVTIRLNLADGSPRHFNGFVSRFAAGAEADQRREYHAEVVPWLWFLTRTSDCRIFQNKTVKEILEQVFKDLGFSDFQTSQIKGNHPQREYCVQYRETDFAFVSRLMEEEGIFYYFKHSSGKHTLVLADQAGAYEDCKESEVDLPRTRATRAMKDHLTRWEHQYEFRSGKWAQTDYNFIDDPARDADTPADLLMTNEQSQVKLEKNDQYEFYDYPGRYVKKDDGNPLTKVRMEEEEAAHDVVRAASLCRSFLPGGKFTVKDHTSPSERGKGYVITAVEHVATEPLAYETGGGPIEQDYRNTFHCIPDKVVFRPPRTTPRPIVYGAQTAVVVGPPNEEIWPDKYGRVKVQFFWDREGKRDDKASCWIRCAQLLAGKGWGSLALPRVGQEVVVSFLEGDPDRPLIIGSVYNADQMPPYPLPDEKTKTYLKSNSSRGGNGYNELCFEDKADHEQIFMHAQRDMDLRVVHDRMEAVGADYHLEVEGERHTKVSKDHSEEIGGDRSLTVGRNHQASVGQKHALQAGTEIHLIAGQKVIIEAGVQLTIKAGSGFVDIGPAGVTIQGMMVNINSGGVPGVGTGSAPTKPTIKKAHKHKSGQKSAPK